MSRPPIRDPKGYYAVLGLTPQADLAAVKRAYRTRAKVLHPDRNPSPRASSEFNALTEAYRVLGDPERRRAYDSAAGAASVAGGWTGDGAGGSPRNRAHPPRRGPSRGAGLGGGGTDGALTPRTCRVCGRATRDLRHLVVLRVRGRGLRVEQTPIEGVFCGAHGDRTAVAASLSCWALGWWALPWGPLLTLQALWVNLWGGRMPAAENYQLLSFQARAFLARGNLPTARVLAEQARPFARTDAERRHVQQLLEALADQPRPRGRAGAGRGGRRRFGSAQVAQLAPLLLIATLALYVAGPSRVIGGLIDTMTAPPAGSGPAEDTGTAQPPAAPSPAPAPTPAPAPAPAPAPPPAAVPDTRSAPEAAPRGPFRGQTAPEVDASRTPDTPAAAALFTVRSPSLPVRLGPGESYRVVATVPAGTVVMIAALAREGTWGRVLSARGISGWVPTDALAPVEPVTDPSRPPGRP